MVLRKDDLSREIVKVLLERRHQQQYEGGPIDPLEEMPDEEFGHFWDEQTVS